MQAVLIELWFYWSKSQTKIPKKWRENLFVPARDFFNSRTKIKIFSDHVFRTEIHRIFQYTSIIRKRKKAV